MDTNTTPAALAPSALALIGFVDGWRMWVTGSNDDLSIMEQLGNDYAAHIARLGGPRPSFADSCSLCSSDIDAAKRLRFA